MKTVFEIAREAGFKEHNGMIYVTTINDDCAKELKAFAELVRAEAIANEQKKWQDQTVVEIHEAILDEREACAKVAEDGDCVVQGRGYYDQLGDADKTARNIAAAIRARSSHDL